jgi:HTH-type transcriptional regulator/antitoxin HigA
MKVRPIRSAKDHRAPLARIAALMDAGPRTLNGDELDVLSTLVEAYERKHHAFAPPDPIQAILFRMAKEGLERKDVEPFIGSRHRVSEVLNGKRGLSLAMIRRLHRGLRIQLAVLVGDAA